MKIIRLICTVLPLFVLGGCFDSRDIKDVAIIMGMAVDTGADTKYSMISQAVIPKALSRGGDSFENLKSVGGEIGECIDKTALQCGKYMYLSHISALLIGEKLAKQGVGEVLDYFLRDNELRANATLAVAGGDTEEIMKAESKLLQVPVSNILSLDRRLGETSLGSAVTVFDFVSDIIKKNCAAMVPVVAVDEKSSIVSGSAIFKEDKMIGKISNTEARGVLWLRDKIENAVLEVNFDETSIDIKVNKAASKINLNIKDGISVSAQITCYVSVLRDNFGVINAYGEETVQQRISETIKSEIEASLYKMQTLGADVYGFGDMIYKKNPEKWREIEGNWEQIFKNLDVDVNVKTTIKERGSVLKSAEKI